MTAPTEPQMREWNCLNHPEVRLVLAEYASAYLKDHRINLPADAVRHMLERFVFSRIMQKVQAARE
jgi:hypothetical protein